MNYIVAVMTDLSSFFIFRLPLYPNASFLQGIKDNLKDIHKDIHKDNLKDNLKDIHKDIHKDKACLISG